MYRLAIIILCLIFCGLQYRLWIADGGYAEVHTLQKKIAKLGDKSAALKTTNQAISVQVKALKKGHAAVEERARSHLGMIRDGEQFYLFAGKHPNAADSSPSE